jgi:transposase
MDLDNRKWALIEPLLPVENVREDGKGRPPIDKRRVIDGILWVLRTGAPWKDLPARYPSRSTCHRWLKRWAEDGTWERVRMALIEDLGCRNELELKEAFVDASFAAGRKGGPASAPRSAEKARNASWLSTAMALLSPSWSEALHPPKSDL